MMFSEEEKEKAKSFKFCLYPQGELEDYLNPRFLPVIYEDILDASAMASAVDIPKQIVLFWHDPKLPEDVQDSIEKIKRFNPEYQLDLFNTDSAGEFIKHYYGMDLYNLYHRRCVHASMKSDLFRICYLAQKGGIYVDVDIDCFASLELIFKSYDFECFLLFSIGNPCCIDNDFIACMANNAIIFAILEKIKENLTIERSFSSIWECTGPGAVSMAILERLMQNILQNNMEVNFLQGLKLVQHNRKCRAYYHAELEYKKTVEGNWRYFPIPHQLYKL